MPEAARLDTTDYQRRSAAGLAGLPPAIDALVERLETPFVRALGVEFNDVRQAVDRATARARADCCRALIRGYALAGSLAYEDGCALMDYVGALEAAPLPVGE